MIRAVILDFDGVLLDSAQAKTNAFRALFQEICPDHMEEAMAYHLANEGVSRYVQFLAVYTELLQQPLSEAKSQELGRRFSALVEAELQQVSLVAGAREFLEQARPHYKLFVASGTPEEELRTIAKARRLLSLVDEWHGAPRSKPEIIRDILARHQLNPNRVVLVGDAPSDWQAAQETEIAFIGRVIGHASRFTSSVEQIEDLWQLPAALRRFETHQVTRGGVR